LPAGPRQRGDLKSAERGMRTAFTRQDMRGFMRQDFIAGAAMG
jgi:hypothetical protein